MNRSAPLPVDIHVLVIGNNVMEVIGEW